MLLYEVTHACILDRQRPVRPQIRISHWKDLELLAMLDWAAVRHRNPDITPLKSDIAFLHVKGLPAADADVDTL